MTRIDIQGVTYILYRNLWSNPFHFMYSVERQHCINAGFHDISNIFSEHYQVITKGGGGGTVRIRS